MSWSACARRRWPSCWSARSCSNGERESCRRNRERRRDGTAMESMKGRAAIAGLGITDMGRIYGHDSTWFAGEAIRLAVEDAGLTKDDIDGLLINAGITGTAGTGGISLPLQTYLGLNKLRLLNHMNAAGSTAAQMVQYASFAVVHGLANYVVCVF